MLLGEKPGDNAQSLRLARALGLPFETKTLVLQPGFERTKPTVEPSLEPFDPERSDPLKPPWPDMVLTIGRRLAMAGLWIKAQSGSTKLALIGVPKGREREFDLVIAPIHYRIAQAPNVLRIGLPLLVPDADMLSSAAEKWRPVFAGMARPLTAVFVGGSTGAHRFTLAEARKLLGYLDFPGSAYIVTSRRTPPAEVRILETGKPESAIVYRWRPDDPENPYFGLLALADQFVVTGDSISMLVEVARLGKPLAIAPFHSTLWQRCLSRGRSRDINVLHEYLYKGGWAVRSGEPFIVPTGSPPDDTLTAVPRLAALLELEQIHV
ncbi:MAG: mitochondrial fission ELM1 family protein [Hyphomicrobiales bacterium]